MCLRALKSIITAMKKFDGFCSFTPLRLYCHNDYNIFVLLTFTHDPIYRFLNSNRQSQISLWMQPHVKCYSKFGDVVFKLTRFFRDGVICGPTKLELTRNVDQENVKSSQPLDQLLSDKLLTTEMSCSEVSVSSTTKQGKSFGHLTEIVPANRSSLTSHKLSLAIKNSSNANLLNYGSKNMQSSFHDTIHSDKNLLSDDKNSQCIAPCSVKKPRLVITGHEQTQNFEKSHDPSSVRENIHVESYSTGLLKNEKLQWSKNGSEQNTRDSKRMLEGEVKSENMTSVSIERKCKEVHSASTTCNDAERKGSAFLIQVQEKLTDEEYKEFVNFMKALKSKTMKIGQVLQSIARLFSLPDRLPLLHRFKDYIPVKYHSLYEQYVQANQNAAGVLRQ